MAKRPKPITLTQQEAIFLVNALKPGGYLYRGALCRRIATKLEAQLDRRLLLATPPPPTDGKEQP
jgi:hypothetical protein